MAKSYVDYCHAEIQDVYLHQLNLINGIGTGLVGFIDTENIHITINQYMMLLGVSKPRTLSNAILIGDHCEIQDGCGRLPLPNESMLLVLVNCL